MAATYLVQIRLGGDIKSRLREIIHDIADRFDVRTLTRSHYVPHVTLYGPFHTEEQTKVLARIRDTCYEYDMVPFRLDGFEHFDCETAYADVHSSRALRQLRSDLSDELQPITYGEQDYDHDHWFYFHSTIARDVGDKFDNIWEYVTSEYDLDYEGYVKRVSLIRNGGIVEEYSLPQGRFLSSSAATSKPGWERDNELIGRYRLPDDHDDLVASQPGFFKRWLTIPSDLKSPPLAKRRSSEFEDRPPRTFLSGDLHLNHENIIEYCDRPFRDQFEMNQRLVSNWNDTVAPQDTVIFVGDLAFYDGTITTRDWLDALNGEIIFIQGNHDDDDTFDYLDGYWLETERRRYYCSHRPENAPEDWDGWIIHGHKHNNDVEEFPFVNPEARRVNVAPELVGYAPLSVTTLETAIEAATSRIAALETDVRDIASDERFQAPNT